MSPVGPITRRPALAAVSLDNPPPVGKTQRMGHRIRSSMMSLLLGGCLAVPAAGQTMPSPAPGAGAGASTRPSESVEEAARRQREEERRQNIERGRADLRFLVSTIAERHPDPWRRISRAAFEREVQAVDESIGRIPDVDIAMQMMRLAAMIGDAHTGLSISGRIFLRSYAFDNVVLSDGMYLTALTKENEELLGARITHFGGVTYEQALRQLATMVPHDNRQWMELQARGLVKTAEVMRFLRLADEDASLRMTVQLAGGGERTVRFRPISVRVDPSTIVVSPPASAVPEMLRLRDEWYGHKLLPDGKTLYAWYDRCTDQRGRPTVAEWGAALAKAAAEPAVEKVVIDLRRNSGGNSALFEPAVDALAGIDKLRKRHAVVALIGRNTFSSGLFAATALRDRATATLVGSPTGGKPNSFGEVRIAELPHSRFTLSYSTKFFQRDRTGNPDAVMPDVDAPTTGPDYFTAPRDVPLEAAVALKVGA